MYSVLLRLLLATAILVVSSLIPAQEQALPRSDQVMKHVATVGPKQAISEYFEKPIWEEIMKGIASGTPEWLNVYSALRPGSDAGSGEDLGEAIAAGIPAAPFRILPLLYAENRGRLSITALCTFTFESSAPSGGISSYVNRIEQFLKSARTQEEISIRKACIHGLAKTRIKFKNSPYY